MRALIATILLTSLTAQAGLYDVPKVTTVQNRKYHLDSDITLQASYLPLDPFMKYAAVGATYTTHFSNFTGWEIINANYALGVPASLKSNLIVDFNGTEADFDYLQYFVSSNLVFSPIYTKNLIFNSSVVHNTISFVAGAGMAGFKAGTKEPSSRFFINVGLVLQYFLSRDSSLKFDFRNQVYLDDTKNTLTLQLGYAFHLGGPKEDEVDLDEFR